MMEKAIASILDGTQIGDCLFDAKNCKIMAQKKLEPTCMLIVFGELFSKEPQKPLGQCHFSSNITFTARVSEFLQNVSNGLVLLNLNLKDDSELERIHCIKGFKNSMSVVSFLVTTRFQKYRELEYAQKNIADHFVFRDELDTYVWWKIIDKSNEQYQYLPSNGVISKKKERIGARFIGASFFVLELKKKLQEISKFPVLKVVITRGPGVKKGLVVCDLYRQGQRKSVYCNSDNSSLVFQNIMEDKLFCSKEVVWNHKLTNKEKIFLQVNDGVLFLDKIGEMGNTFQIKLLQFLQKKMITLPLLRFQNCTLLYRGLEEFIFRDNWNSTLTYPCTAIFSQSKYMCSCLISSQQKILYRRRKVISTLIDSYANNINPYSLTILKWWVQQRISDWALGGNVSHNLFNTNEWRIVTFENGRTFEVLNSIGRQKNIQCFITRLHDFWLLNIQKEKFVISGQYRRLLPQKDLFTFPKIFLDKSKKVRWNILFFSDRIKEKKWNFHIYIFDETYRAIVVGKHPSKKLAVLDFNDDWIHIIRQARSGYQNKLWVIEESDKTLKFSHFFRVPNRVNLGLAIQYNYRFVDASWRKVCVFDKIEQTPIKSCWQINNEGFYVYHPVLMKKNLEETIENRRYDKENFWEFFEEKIVRKQRESTLGIIHLKLPQDKTDKRNNRELFCVNEASLLWYTHRRSTFFHVIDRIPQIAGQKAYWNQQIKRFVLNSGFKRMALFSVFKSKDKLDVQMRA